MCYDVLKLLRENVEGVQISKIARLANLSHYASLDKLEILIKSQLAIQENRIDYNSMYDHRGTPTRVWKITPKGIQILNMISEIESMTVESQLI